jgi:ABC-type glutathione transport system ATPase component
LVGSSGCFSDHTVLAHIRPAAASRPELTTTFKVPHGVVKAVDKVSLELRRGETLALLANPAAASR